MLPFLRSQLHKFCFSTSGVCEAAAFFLVLLYQVSFAQTTYTWVPTGGGSWTSATNWSPNGVPSDGDDVIIPAGHTGGTINNVPAVTLRDLVVNGTGNCVFQASASVNTVSVDRTFSVVAGKTLTLGQAGGRINFTLNASAQGAVYGTVRLNASGATDRFFTNNGDLSIYPGGLVDGTGESNFITTAGSTLRIGSPQGITLSAAAGSIQMSGTPTNRTYSTDANYVYIGNANQAVGNGLPATVNSLTIQNTGTAGNNTVTLASSITVTNALTVTSGVLAIGANNINGVGSVILNGTTITGSGTINLNGDVTTLAAGTTAVINPPVNLGTASRTFTVNDSPVNPDLILNNVISGSGGLLKNGNGALTLTGSNTFSGGLTLNTGALNINHANALGNTLGAFTINGGTVNNTSGAAITTANYTINWNGDFTFSGSNDLNLGTGTVAVSGNRVVTTSAGILTFGGVINAPGASLTKNGSGTLSFGSNAVTLNAFTVNAGTLVSTSGTLTLSGSFLVAGTFLHNNGTVHYNGGATQQLAGVNYFNLQLSNSGQKNAVGAVNVSNNLVNTSVLDMAGFTLTAGGTVSNSGGTVRFAGPANGLAIGSGTVEYYGASQTVDSGIYENLIINQSSGEAVPDGDVTVNGVLTLSNGRLNLAGNILYLGSSASVSVASPSSSRMIIATGGGEVIKTFSTAGSFTFPIGDNTGAYDYAPITVNVTSASGFPGNVSASVDDFKHPNNASTTHFLTRYWSVNTTLTAVTANVAAVYPSADINGTEANIRAARLSGGFNQVSNPWVKFAALGGNTLNASGTPLLNGVVNVFTGIRGADPTVTISGGGITICQGTSVNLSTAATADPAILYEWSPAAGLSATNVPDPIASPTVTTTYTVTIRDGNGITGSDNTTITVNPKPATPVVTPAGPVEACTGTAPLVLTSNAPSGNQWYRNGLPLPGETSTTLTLPTAPASNGSYSVVSTVSGCASDESNIVNVTITPAPVVNAGSDAETCQGVTFNFSSQATPASASNYSSILWTHTGTGTLTNATTLTPTYTPGAGETGPVTFTLTANGNGSCAPVNDQMILTITPAPVVNAGSDAETCQGVTFNFSSQATPASASNYSSILWTHTGTGTLTNATTLTPDLYTWCRGDGTSNLHTDGQRQWQLRTGKRPDDPDHHACTSGECGQRCGDLPGRNL
ncbi:MAG: hypothetical protein KatS3mg032_0117 [Cyclobacteriaceae bacterium]|nr:MAG: hypothetical protein KatS3mg032_0117 [Cyclobacteriaceae bacterium]